MKVSLNSFPSRLTYQDVEIASRFYSEEIDVIHITYAVTMATRREAQLRTLDVRNFPS